MTYEMKDFQEDEKTLRKQAKDGEISEEEFFLALKKLHNRATEGDSHLVQLARSIGISEDELFSVEECLIIGFDFFTCRWQPRCSE